MGFYGFLVKSKNQEKKQAITYQIKHLRRDQDTFKGKQQKLPF